MILGSRIGVRVLHRTEPRIIRHVVIALLALSGIMSILRGIGVL
jgi:uncharacterized membrane protein YfcA